MMSFGEFFKPVLSVRACSIGAVSVSNGSASAAYPDRVIKIVVPFAPGGGTDVVARTLAQEMAKNLGVNVLIENKPGAGTIIGTQAVAVSEPDGYTLLMGTFANAVNPSLNPKLPYDPHKDFARDRAHCALVQHRRGQSPIPDQIDRRPDRSGQGRTDKLSYGTFGIGTSAHLAGELFKNMAKVNLTTVQYKGAAPAITDLLSGQIQVMFTTVASAASLIASRTVARVRRDLGGTLAGVSGFAGGRGGRRARLFGGKPGTACSRRPKRRVDHRPFRTSPPHMPRDPRRSKTRRERRPGHGREPPAELDRYFQWRRRSLAAGDQGCRHQDRIARSIAVRCDSRCGIFAGHWGCREASVLPALAAKPCSTTSVETPGRTAMFGIARRVLAVASISICTALPALAQDTVRIRGAVERIDGPVYVVKNRDGAEVKLTLTDNPLFVAIVPSKMADVKPGMFVGSAGTMQYDGTQKAIEVHIFPESMRGTGEGHYDWDLLPKSKMTNGNVEHAVYRRRRTGAVGQIQGRREEAGVTPKPSWSPTKSASARRFNRAPDIRGRREAAARRHAADAAHHLWPKWRGSGILEHACALPIQKNCPEPLQLHGAYLCVISYQ